MNDLLLTAQGIQRFLPAGHGLNITVLPTVGSTNTMLKTMAQNGAPHGTVLLSNAQSAGRGRLGRNFFSPQGGIYFSVLIKKQGPIDPSAITPAAAVATATAIESISGASAQIKWVNDIFVNQKKICGILTEGDITAGWAVVGVGINLAPPVSGFPDHLPQAGALFDCLPESKIACRLAARAINRVAVFCTTPPGDLVEQYRRRCMTVGSKVSFEINGRSLCGMAQSIDDRFSLVVQADDGQIHTLQTGEAVMI